MIIRQQGNSLVGHGSLLCNSEDNHSLEGPVLGRFMVCHNYYLSIRRRGQPSYCLRWVVDGCDHLQEVTSSQQNLPASCTVESEVCTGSLREMATWLSHHPIACMPPVRFGCFTVTRGSLMGSWQSFQHLDCRTGKAYHQIHQRL